jgi:RecB family exonuclease
MSVGNGTMVAMTAVDQLSLGGMPRRLFACTPSRLNSWVDCPRRYRMTYLDRPRPAAGPPWAHNSLGASVHNALAGWWRLPLAGRTPDGAAALLEAGWSSEGFRDPAQAAGWLARARDMVRRYVATLDPGNEPLGVERTVGVRTQRLALSGRLDRLDDRPVDDGSADRAGELVVVDYKSGRRPLTADDARGSLALALYAIAASSMFRRRCVRVELHHLASGQVHAFEHTDASLQRHLRRAEQIADDAAAAALSAAAAPGSDPFPPRPGTQCGWCDLRAHCPEGSAATPARLPWAAVGEPDSDG